MYQRMISLLCVFGLLFSAVLGRTASIAFSNTYAVSDGYNSISVEIGSLYPTITDRNGVPLTNRSAELVAVIRPNEKCMSELELLFDEDKIADIIQELSDGYPVIKTIDKYAKTEYITVTEKILRHDGSLLCRHMIGAEYGGLEKLYSEKTGEKKVTFTVDALGRVLAGDPGTMIEENYDSQSVTVATALDSEIQKIAESAASSISTGAVVVLNCDTSEVLAAVSCGEDYLNRSVSPYAVGSIFKLLMCCCAAENDMNPVFNCTGSITVGDSVYSCQNAKSHGLQTMKTALANSCNCYFVNLALELGAEPVYEMAASFGFGGSTQLFDGWEVSNGNLPSLSVLSSKGMLALLGFGQGSLTDTPLHFAAFVSAVANGGVYRPASLSAGRGSKETDGARVISAETAETVRDYMRYVVSNGTGKNADYNGKSAGKTSTAQSGRYSGGKELLNTWFAGFYPYDNPKYAIVVMKEGGSSGSGDCCPVFRTIVESLEKM